MFVYVTPKTLNLERHNSLAKQSNRFSSECESQILRGRSAPFDAATPTGTKGPDLGQGGCQHCYCLIVIRVFRVLGLGLGA